MLLAKPLTFMNDSGQAVGELVRYFKIDAADLLVIVDEVQLPLGRLRARARGSAGGHNGLKSVIAHLGDEFARLRLGVGRGDSRERDLADHVLARFEPDEAAEAERMTARAADAAETFITSGIAAVMNAVQRRRSGDNRIARRTLATRLVASASSTGSATSERQPSPEGAAMADRQYELVYILPPDTTEQQAAELHEQIASVVSRMNGQIEKTENWGRRRLAYEIGAPQGGRLRPRGDQRLGRSDEGARSPAEGDGPGHPAHDRPGGRGEEGRRPHADASARPNRSAGASSAGCRRSGSRARAAREDDEDDGYDRFDGVEV